MSGDKAERKPLRTLEQRRAAKAWDQVSHVPDGRKAEEYYSIVRQAPAMVQINGLGQTLAFLLAKEKKSAKDIQNIDDDNLGAHGLLYKHLEEWLIGNEKGTPSVEDEEIRRLQAPIPWTTNLDTVIERVISEDSVIYRHATREALAYLSWLKRFAESRFGK